MIVWLFVPGDQGARIPKALDTAAARVIVDWEDAVAPSQKKAARAGTEEILSAVENRDRVVLRINPAGSSEHADDIEAARRIRPGAVMVAKTQGPEDLRPLADAGIPVVPLVESALGIERAFAIASAPGVTDLAFGTIDFLADIGAPHGRESLLHARSRLVIAARAAGVRWLLDGPMLALDDESALIAEAEHARSLGFDGKLAIHPRQVEQLDRHFQPSADAIADAQEILRAYREALQSGKGAVRLGDRMIDGAVAKQAERLLAASVTRD
jgi:citrate lyase subunit beta/citryl-CoA lyase